MRVIPYTWLHFLKVVQEELTAMFTPIVSELISTTFRYDFYNLFLMLIIQPKMKIMFTCSWFKSIQNGVLRSLCIDFTSWELHNGRLNIFSDGVNKKIRRFFRIWPIEYDGQSMDIFSPKKVISFLKKNKKKKRSSHH